MSYVSGLSGPERVAGPGIVPRDRVHREDRADGSVVLRSGHPLGRYPASMAEVFAARAREHPERLLVAQRDGDGWRRVSWARRPRGSRRSPRAWRSAVPRAAR